MSALAEVVSSSVNDNGTADDALGANQLDQLVRGAALSIALAVGLEVAQVTDVALVVFGRAVRLVVGVDWMMVLVWVFFEMTRSAGSMFLRIRCRVDGV